MSQLGEKLKAMYILSMVNIGIWAIGLIAMVYILENGESVKGMYVILAGGTAVGIQIISMVSKLRNSQV